MSVAAPTIAKSLRIAISDRYWLLRPLATGGMAEIYLARQGAMAGFEKEVVIKRLKPELARDPRVVEMFLDEARIGAQLNHPNVVHVYDVDEHEGVPYIAMEYIVGEELVQLCRRGLAHGKFLPLEHAVELIRQAAAGLGYVHSKQGSVSRDNKEPHPLHIVHCDISPTNLLITQDGFLKIIDFGIARAQGQRARDEGALPGKLSYMSPEQAGRRPTDRRSDIFSLGVVLYEITVGRRLFKGPAQEVLQRLEQGTIELPTFVNHDFPGALEAIILRALERHPENRYQSAYDLADDLEGFLRERRQHSGPVRIARYLDELALADGGTRRPELISEQELVRAHEELELDRQLFDGYHPAPAAAEGPSEWDEFVETDAAVARALGIAPTQLRVARTRTPAAGLAAMMVAAPPDDTSPHDRLEPGWAEAAQGPGAAVADGVVTGTDDEPGAGDDVDVSDDVEGEGDDGAGASADGAHAVGEGAIVDEAVDGPGGGGDDMLEGMAVHAASQPMAPMALQPMAPVVIAGPPGRPTMAQAMPWLVLCTCAGVAIGLLCGLLL